MKNTSKLVAAGLLLTASFSAQAVDYSTLGFDDHDWGGNERENRPPAREMGTTIDGMDADNYHGFDWNNGTNQIAVINATMYDTCHPGSNIANGATSGHYAAFNARGETETQIDWSGTGTFDFIGANWTTFGDTDFNLSFEGWRAGELVYSSSDHTITGEATLISLNWDDIDSLRISSSIASTWIMDDFTVSAVPEPSVMALMLGGLGFVGFMAARSRKK